MISETGTDKVNLPFLPVAGAGAGSDGPFSELLSDCVDSDSDEPCSWLVSAGVAGADPGADGLCSELVPSGEAGGDPYEGPFSELVPSGEAGGDPYGEGPCSGDMAGAGAGAIAGAPGLDFPDDAEGGLVPLSSGHETAEIVPGGASSP